MPAPANSRRCSTGSLRAAEPSRRPSTAARQALWAVVALLIGYGSLYPFRFHFPGLPLVSLLHVPLWTRPSDVFGNVLLFVPWGLAGWWAGRGTAGHRALPVFVAGLAYALLLQVLQLWLPMRTASLGDVFWNVSGLIVGLALAPWLRDAPRTACGAILAAWLLGLLLPLLPLLPADGHRAWLREAQTALAPPSPAALVWHIAGGWLCVRLLLALGRGPRAVAALIAAVLLLRPALPEAPLDPALALGLPFGALCAVFGRERGDGPLIALLLVAYTFDGLWPFVWRPVGVVALLPFDSLLHGSMLNNLRHLTARLAIYAGVQWLVQQRRGRLPAVAVCGLALWVGAVEGAQAWLVGRYADAGELLWVLLAAGLVHLAGPVPATLQAVADAPDAHPPATGLDVLDVARAVPGGAASAGTGAASADVQGCGTEVQSVEAGVRNV